MLELMLLVAALWLAGKFLKLAVRVSWSLAKVAASILFGIAIPALLFGLLAAGGIVIVVAILMIGVAISILKFCL